MVQAHPTWHTNHHFSWHRLWWYLPHCAHIQHVHSRHLRRWNRGRSAHDVGSRWDFSHWCNNHSIRKHRCAIPWWASPTNHLWGLCACLCPCGWCLDHCRRPLDSARGDVHRLVARNHLASGNRCRDHSTHAHQYDRWCSVVSESFVRKIPCPHSWDGWDFQNRSSVWTAPNEVAIRQI